ncbi:MAG: tetratricopeptide repeat protein, partial [Chloroflexi bacterium]|nr:tetratricopeptide repeat protein [Chloroflexota bacterium]
PATAATLASVGEEHAFLGEMEEAESLFRRALDRMPRSPDIREKLAMTLVQQRRMDEGIAELSVALDQEPGNTTRRDLLANSLLHAERYQEAADLLTADPEEVLSWESLMCLSVARSRLQGGHEFADAIMNPLPPESPPQESTAAPLPQEAAG